MSMMKRTALVTGATRGIGKAIAESLARQGYQVVGTATSAKGAQEVARHLASCSSTPCAGKVVQLEDASSIEQLFDELEEESLSPTILVANAGVAADNLILRMKMEEWQKDP